MSAVSPDLNRYTTNPLSRRKARATSSLAPRSVLGILPLERKEAIFQTLVEQVIRSRGFVGRQSHKVPVEIFPGGRLG